MEYSLAKLPSHLFLSLISKALEVEFQMIADAATKAGKFDVKPPYVVKMSLEFMRVGTPPVRWPHVSFQPR